MTDSLKLKYDQLGKREQPKSEDDKTTKPNDEILLHETEGHARNLTLILADGKRVFLNYAYLVSGDLSAENDAITLIFTSHTVTLKGYALAGLFEALSAHVPKQIKSMEERYVSVKKETQSVVIQIEVHSIN